MATTFSFTKESLDEQFYSEIGAIGAYEMTVLNDLANIIFAFLTQQGQLIEPIEAFAQSNSLKPVLVKSQVKTLLTVVRGALRYNATAKNLFEDLMQLGMAQDRSKLIAKYYNQNYVAMSRTAIGQTLMVNKLVDLDWKFGVTIGSNQQRQVGSTFLQLKLVLDKGEKTENIYMELTLEQFYKFLRDMEIAKNSLDYFS